MKRRAVLGTIVGSSVITVAGCASRVSDSVLVMNDDPNVDGDPPAIPDSLDCEMNVEELFPNVDDESRERGFTRFPEFDDTVEVQEISGWSLRINGSEFEYGDVAEIQLESLTDSQMTGNRNKFHLEIFTDEGWMDVRVVLPPFGGERTDEAKVHDSEIAFEWDLSLTENGVVEQIRDRQQEWETVCPDLQTGRYRFVYNGFPGQEKAVAVMFDLQT